MKNKTKRILNPEFNVIVNVTLCYKIRAKNANEAFKIMWATVIPNQDYNSEESFKIIKAVDEDGKEFFEKLESLFSK